MLKDEFPKEYLIKKNSQIQNRCNSKIYNNNYFKIQRLLGLIKYNQKIQLIRMINNLLKIRSLIFNNKINRYNNKYKRNNN